MEGLTLSAKEQNRSQVLNGVMSGQWCMSEAAQVLGVSERHGWRLLAAYRKEGAAALAHKNRGRMPLNATPMETQQQVAYLAQERYGGLNHTHLTELLAEREGNVVSADGEAHPGESWGQQSTPPSSTPTSLSQTENASGRNDAPAGWELS